MDNVLEAKNINKHFLKPKDFHVLKDISFAIKQGEFASIMGKSGSGKSTLLYILSTMDTDYTGELFLNNELVTGRLSTELSRIRNEHIGFIFQFHQLLPEFTALENVCIPAFIKQSSKAEAEKRAKELLDFLGLKDRYHHKPNELPGGEQQRVAVARALINKPAIIFADEPSGNLDTHTAENLHQLFFKLRDEFGQTFVIVTHNEELANMADRKLVMVDGNIV